MTDLLDPILRRWPWAALAASLAMLGAAHAFETFGRLAPCELCLKERLAYWIAAGVAVAGIVLSRTPARLPRLSSAVLALVFLASGALAAYHAGVEWKFWPGPASCTGGTVQVTAADLSRLLHGGPVGAPACDKAAWVFLGLSMAGWNALISLGLAALSLLAMARSPSEGHVR